MSAPDDGADLPDGRDDEPAAEGANDDAPGGAVGWLRWFLSADSGLVVYVRDGLTSVAVILLVALLLFAISGTWPPMVAVESASMEPNMHAGDLVFVVDTDRFVPEAAVEYRGETTGVVPADRAASIGYTEFGRPGDVVIFMGDGDPHETPVIHRAMLFVEEDENWYDRAVTLDPEAVGNADSCEELNNCPAPNAGFVTKGDNEEKNKKYDQVKGLSSPVKPGWIIGTAELKVPYLGYVRLAFSGQVAPAADVAPAPPGRVATTRDDAPPARNSPPTAAAPSSVPAATADRPVA